MDVNSGAVHVVDDIVYDMISMVEPLVKEGVKDPDTVKAAVLACAGLNYGREEIEEAVDEVLEEWTHLTPDIQGAATTTE